MRDITLRALDVLDNADIVLCENTRQTSKLLREYKIKPKRLISFNKYNENKKGKELADILDDDSLKIAIVSDAGTPLINDPGFRVVRDAIKNNIKVVPVPGPSAVLSSLVASGMPVDRFAFMGFMPKQNNAKKKIIDIIKLNANQGFIRTYVFFESPYRIAKTIKAVAYYAPDANICLCRELTKRFESFYYSKAKELWGKGIKEKGEFTIIISFEKNGKRNA